MSDGPVFDLEAGSLTVDEIGQCDYEFVPVFRGGERVEGQVRPCKNAVRKPATTCHQHGGAVATSLGRSVAKARAEAERGECFPLAAEHWEQADERLAVLEGQLLTMLDTNIDDLARMYVEFTRQQRSDGIARFSTSNQMLVLMQHYINARNDGVAEKDLGAEAVRRASEPHLTEKAWKEKGRTILENEAGVPVVWWQPGGARTPEREDGETDEEFEKRCKEQTRYWRGRHGAVIQYPLSATTGEPYEIAPDPIGSYRPSGFGDPDAAIETMERTAREMGVTVRFVDEKPQYGFAYWQASKNEIVVWNNIAGGDRRAVAHSLAHELGHARLGHSTDAQAEDRTHEKEVAAESFAALACAHHGIDTSDMSAWYVDHWRQQAGVDMKAGGLGPLRSALTAFDEYRTATT